MWDTASLRRGAERISDAKFRTVERQRNNCQSKEHPSAHVLRIRVSPETIVCPLSVKVEIRLG